MTAALTPATVSELADAVRSTPRLVPVGAGTKPRLAATDAVKLGTTQLRGMIEYDPTEFTFTALAGTPVQEIAATLAERGQYLPFDPFFVEAGSTLGGAVASGLSGPGRFRFGGVRDFILGVRFVDGEGRVLRLGGKVVKNAAGFDIPKFFVGSLGRFGVLAETTFKVFPRAASTLTVKIPVETIEAAAIIFMAAATSRWEPDALDLLPESGHVCLRLVGPAAAIETIAKEIQHRWSGEIMSPDTSKALWSGLREFSWAHAGGVLVKVALSPARLAVFDKAIRALQGVRVHMSAGGNVAFLSLPSPAEAGILSNILRDLELSGVTLRGTAPLWCGLRTQTLVAERVKEALDPHHRFPAVNE